MSKPNKPWPIAGPILATIAALAEFAACFLSVRSSMAMLIVMVLSEIILIAAALTQWVVYFRGYIAQQIDARMQNPPNKSSAISD